MAILPVAFCPFLPAVLDGQNEEDIWVLPPAIPFFVRPKLRWIPEAQTQVYTSYDEEGFNIAFRCFEDAPDRVERSSGPPEANNLYHDDLVGFRFIPEDADPALRPFHFIMTAAGEMYQEETPGQWKRRQDFPCRMQDGETDWVVEGRLLFKSLNLKSPQSDERWGFSAYRQRIGSRWERSGWIEVGLGPFGETMPGWITFQNQEQTTRQRGFAIEPYLRRFGELLEIRTLQVAEAQTTLAPDACPVTRHRINLMIRSLLSIKNDMLYPFHPDALRHYAQTLQFNVGRLDELIENLRQGEDPHTSPDGYVFLGTRLEADDSIHAFALLQGRGYESTSTHPLMVMLDGFTEDWIADSRQYQDLTWPKELDFLMAIPSGVGVSRQFRLAAEDEIFGVIREVRRRFSADPQRTILIGLGPGANAAYQLANRFPNVFSSVVLGGPINPLYEGQTAISTPLYYWAGPEAGWVGPLLKVGEGMAQNLAMISTAGPSALTPKFIQRLTRMGYTAHNATDLIAPSMRYNRGRWARIDRMDDYSRPAKLHLKVKQDGQVNVDADNVGSFTIFPHEGPFIPGQSIRLHSQGQLLATGSFGQFLQHELTPAPKGLLVKTADLAGPIDEAFHGRMIYVYGTQGTDAQTDMLRKAACQACRWPQYDLRIPVKADHEITEEDLTHATLHLFGGLLNSIYAGVASRLPVLVQPTGFSIGEEKFEGPDWVCQFIFPNPLKSEKYILAHLANSESGWFYRGWFPKKEQREPLPDLWVARLQDNPDIGKAGVPPAYAYQAWFDAQWRIQMK